MIILNLFCMGCKRACVRQIMDRKTGQKEQLFTFLLAKGKSVEKQGRKATGLRAGKRLRSPGRLLGICGKGGLGEMENTVHSTLDKEWEQLMVEAKEIGMTTEEVRTFFQESLNNLPASDINHEKGNVL